MFRLINEKAIFRRNYKKKQVTLLIQKFFKESEVTYLTKPVKNINIKENLKNTSKKSKTFSFYKK